MIKNKVFILVLLSTLTGCQSTSNHTKSVPPTIANAVENRTEIKPIIHIEAMYPKDAIAKNIEGYCRVSFDIKLNEPSKPHNIKILECSPKDVFENSCTNSVEKWLFVAKNTSESPTGLITTCKFKLG
jgi:outer membrane biosynthesis protein TonB